MPSERSGPSREVRLGTGRGGLERDGLAGELSRLGLPFWMKDSDRAGDFNLVATEDGDFVEVQGSGEESTFSEPELDEMMALAGKGIVDLIAAQRAVLARIMVTPPES